MEQRIIRFTKITRDVTKRHESLQRLSDGASSIPLMDSAVAYAVLALIQRGW